MSDLIESNPCSRCSGELGCGLNPVATDSSDSLGVGCAGEVVCHCLQVTQGELMAALATRRIRTLKDIKRETGAGDGCMVCHRRLRRYLEQYSDYLPSPPSDAPAP